MSVVKSTCEFLLREEKSSVIDKIDALKIWRSKWN